MKREQNLNCLVAWLLAVLIAFGGVGCMVTGLKLEVSSLWLLALACAASAAISALCYRYKHGGWVLLALLFLGGLWFVREPERMEIFWGQVRAMLHRMTSLWNNAYGWHVISLRAERLSDIPLMLVGGFVAMVIARTVCRRKRAILAIIVALLPLGACLVVTDTVPDTAFLFVLLLGLAVLLLSNSVRRFDLWQGLELTGMASVASAAALALLFFLWPESSYVNQSSELRGYFAGLVQELPASLKEWGQQYVNEDIQTIQPQRESLDTLGDRILREYTVLEVTAPYDGILYLRGQDFDSYDGHNWIATRNRAEGFNLPYRQPVIWEDSRHQITVTTSTPKDVRYVPYYPQAETSFVGGKLSNDEHLLTYSFLQLRLRADWQEVLADSSYDIPQDDGVYITSGMYDPAADIWRYRTLPLETKEGAQEILKFVLTGEETTTAQKAEAIRQYVQASKRYSLTPEKMPAGAEDFALWFLWESDSGYCVHFATAAAVLLRAAGIDARYVTGYVLNTVMARTVAVPASQAHAWVEYFEPAINAWIPLEATPADQLLGDPVLVTEPELTPGEDVTTNIDISTEPSTEDLEDTEPFTEDSRSDPTVSTAPGTEPEKTPDLSALAVVLKWIFLSGLAAGLVYGQYRLRLSLRRKRQRRGSPNARALALWEETLLLHRLLKQPVPEPLEILAQKAKFSQHTLTREETGCFSAAIREAREQLQSQSFARRLIHRLIFAAY